MAAHCASLGAPVPEGLQYFPHLLGTGPPAYASVRKPVHSQLIVTFLMVQQSFLLRFEFVQHGQQSRLPHVAELAAIAFGATTLVISGAMATPPAAAALRRSMSRRERSSRAFAGTAISSRSSSCASASRTREGSTVSPRRSAVTDVSSSIVVSPSQWANTAAVSGLRQCASLVLAS